MSQRPIAQTRAPHHLVGRSMLAALVAVGAAVALTHGATAQEASAVTAEPRAGTTITVVFEPSSMDGIPHYLAAQLTTDDGSAVVGERVQIRRTADVFGGRTVTIGLATTDNAGIGRVPVTPREELYDVTASYGGSETLAPAEIADIIAFPAETVSIPEEVPRGGLVDPQLRPLADLMPIAIGAAVIVVWVVLVGLAVVTLLRIRSSGRSGATAPAHTSAETPDTPSGSQNG